ncbi:hypothetical protein SGLAM104S_09050 [Streptomyces glaucescens]
MIRSPEGDRFYLIATDLRMYKNSSGSWDEVQRHGSKSVMIWESTDLVHWTDQRLVKVAPDNAGNTWAPEAYWDDSLDAYVVFWASKLYADDDPGHTGSTYNKMLYATTKDFRTFSAPKVSTPGCWPGPADRGGGRGRRLGRRGDRQRGAGRSVRRVRTRRDRLPAQGVRPRGGRLHAVGDRRRRTPWGEWLSAPFDSVDPQRVVCRYDVSAVFDEDLDDDADDVDLDADEDAEEDEDLEPLDTDR